jgi:RNA polymerase sigma factor (sigma-70 family)
LALGFTFGTDQKMSAAVRELLRRFLVSGYDDLRTRLTRRLGSADLASDALQETYLRLDSTGELAPVKRPQPYLFRIATNIALKRMEADRRTVSLDDMRAALGIPDETPSPERIVEDRSEIELFQKALSELTPRRREILLASRLDGVMLREIAARMDVSQRLVEIELKHALAHCALRLGRSVVRRSRPRLVEGSVTQGDEDTSEEWISQDVHEERSKP